MQKSWLSRNWLWVFVIPWSVFITLPLLAPLFMRLGWQAPAQLIYTIYSFVCHQLPERSFFLFGPKLMYSLPEIQAAFQQTNDPNLLRQFVGSPELGWKVAWSDRMFSMYSFMLPAALIWYPLRRKLGILPVWGFLFMLLPMAIDGTAHLISDFAGLGEGFRDTNAWLGALTNNVFSPSFYAGDAVGSFNSWMRLITGVFFAIGIIWLSFPYLAEGFEGPLSRSHLRPVELPRL